MTNDPEQVMVSVDCQRCDSTFSVPLSVVAQSQELLEQGCPGSDYECAARYYASLIDRETLKQLTEACCEPLTQEIIAQAPQSNPGVLKMQDNPSDRLRPHAAARLAQDEESFDLLAIANKLRQEEQPSTRGHRQMTIFKKEKVTVVLFAFEAGAQLKEHATSGTVTIQCVEGALTVGTQAQDYELKEGQLVALSPDIAHDVRADQPSVMLLTVAR